MEAKINKKHIHKWVPRLNASWHRVLSDFVGFGEPSWRQVGLKNRWKIDPKRLGRFHIARGTPEEAPERESLNFQWFLEVWGG